MLQLISCHRNSPHVLYSDIVLDVPLGRVPA